MKNRIAALMMTVALLALANGPGALAGGYLAPSSGAGHENTVVVRSHEATIDITDQVATVNGKQEFFNPSTNPVETLFVLPLGERASVTGYATVQGGVRSVGKISEKEAARATYETFSSTGAGLIEQQTPGKNDFTASIAPIGPAEAATVEFTYSEVLPYDGGVVRFVYPIAADDAGRGRGSLTVKMTVRDRKTVTRLWSPYPGSKAARVDANTWILAIAKPADEPMGDLVVYYEVSSASMGLTMLADRNDGDGHFMLLVAPQELTREEDVLTKHMTFVVDVSGSMSGDKIDRAKAAFAHFADTLNPRDTMSIIPFSTRAMTLSEKPVRANIDGKAWAADMVSGLSATGGTNVEGALATALSADDGSCDAHIVVFMTDGRPTQGDTRTSAILATVRRNLGRSRIFVYGVGSDLDPDLLGDIAREGRGEYTAARDGDDLKTHLELFSRKVSVPLLVDVSVEIEGVGAYGVYPAVTQNLYKGSQMVVTGRYSGSGTGRVLVKGTHSGGTEKTFSFDMEFPAEERAYPFVPRLWARERVEDALKTINGKGETPELKAEVMELARRYNFVTPYTSFVAVRQAPRLAANPVRRPSSPASRASVKSRPMGNRAASSGRSDTAALASSRNASVGMFPASSYSLPRPAAPRPIPASVPAARPSAPQVERKGIMAPSFFPFMPSFSKSRRQARVKACIANMRTMEGALEMFDMDSPTTFSLVNGPITNYSSALVGGKYLKSMPICKSGGEYEIVGAPDATAVKCSCHGTVEAPSDDNGRYAADRGRRGSSFIESSHDTGTMAYVNVAPGSAAALAVDSINFCIVWAMAVGNLMILVFPAVLLVNPSYAVGTLGPGALKWAFMPVILAWRFTGWAVSSVMGETGDDLAAVSDPSDWIDPWETDEDLDEIHVSDFGGPFGKGPDDSPSNPDSPDPGV